MATSVYTAAVSEFPPRSRTLPSGTPADGSADAIGTDGSNLLVSRSKGLDVSTLRDNQNFQSVASQIGPKLFINPAYGEQWFKFLLVKYPPYTAAVKLAQMCGVDPTKPIPDSGFVNPDDRPLTLDEWVTNQLDKLAASTNPQDAGPKQWAHKPGMGPWAPGLPWWHGGGWLWHYAKVDPLVIDLSGKGLNITDLSQSNTFFARSDSGPQYRTSWIGSGSGFLTLPVADGNVSHTSNLITSFSQLLALDSNGDGKIDALDPAYNQLRVWQDMNVDEISDASELKGLQGLGIASISLGTSTTPQSIGSSIVIETALAVMVDGSTREIASIELSYDPSEAKMPSTLNAAAPLGFSGYGSLPDLGTAVSEDPVLAGMLDHLATEAYGISSLDSTIENMLMRWAEINEAGNNQSSVFSLARVDFLRQLNGDEQGLFGEHSAYPYISGQARFVQEAWDVAFGDFRNKS